MITINFAAHDGISGIYTGVGRIAYDTVSVLTRSKILNQPYRVNCITGKYNSDCLGYNPEIERRTLELCQKTGGDVYLALNGSQGNVSYGDLENWKNASLSAATILKQIYDTYPNDTHINICLDTPYAQVAVYYQQYGFPLNSYFVWVPHSTARIHKIDSIVASDDKSFSSRVLWEENSIKLLNSTSNCFTGYIGQYMKTHLTEDYFAKVSKLINFTNGLDIKNSRYTHRRGKQKVANILRNYNIPLDKDLLLSFGRLERYKGFDFSIIAGGQLVDNGVQTVIIAQPYTPFDPMIQDLRNVIAKHNPSASFIHDYQFDLPHSLLEWPRTKIVLIPSVAEPFGLIPEEIRLYNYQHLSIVASQREGFLEQITDGKDGFLIDTENLSNAIQKLKFILNMDVSQKAAIAQEGFSRAIKDYNLEKNLTVSLNEILRYA